jgi:hypothetical protein
MEEAEQRASSSPKHSASFDRDLVPDRLYVRLEASPLPTTMPAVKSGRILVTGASGFIAVWCVERALKAGFEVVGSKANFNADWFSSSLSC